MTPDTKLIEVACALGVRGEAFRRSGRAREALAMMAQAYSAALMGYGGVPATAEFLPRSPLPDLAHLEHLRVRIMPQSIRLEVPEGVLHRSLTHIRRLNIVGCLCGTVARSLPAGAEACCVVDIGDGMDVGDYHRFSFSSASPKASLIPDPYFFETTGYEDLRRQVPAEAPPWEGRRDVVFWRGAATGHATDFTRLPRLLMCLRARQMSCSERVDVGVTSLHQIPEEHVRHAIAAAGWIKPEVDKGQFMQYRYQIDIDGNSNAWGLIEKMIMGSTILKVASRDGCRQWFYDRLVAWKHFVPVAADLSDFENRVTWLFDNPGKAREIAANATALAEELDFRTVMRDAEEHFFRDLACFGIVSA